MSLTVDLLIEQTGRSPHMCELERMAMMAALVVATTPPRSLHRTDATDRVTTHRAAVLGLADYCETVMPGLVDAVREAIGPTS